METAFTLAIFALTLLLFLLDRPRYDLVGLLALLALILTHVLTPTEAFAGFSNPALLSIAALFLFARAFAKTGLLRALAEKLLGGIRSEAALLLAIPIVAGLLSSFALSAAVAATMLPVLLRIGRERDIAPSRLLLPMSFGALLGGTALLVGSSTNFGVQAALLSPAVEASFPKAAPIALFDFLPWGLALIGLGGLYFATIGRKLLPRRRAEKDLAEQYRVRHFLCEVRVESQSPLAGKTLAQSGLGARENATILGLTRQGEPISPLDSTTRIEAGDLLLLQGEPQSLLRLQAELSLTLQENRPRGEGILGESDERIREGIVAPGSRYAGQSLRELGFRGRTGLTVIALWRHGEVYPLGLKEMSLRVGDALLLQGPERDLERLKRDGDFLLTEEIEPAPAPGRGAWLTAGIFFSSLVAVAFGLLDLPIALLTGAGLLILLRVLPLREAYESVDWPLLLLMVGMLALSTALVKRGLAEDLAQLLASAIPGEYRTSVLAGALFLASAALAQFTRNQAAGVLVAPVALAVATQAQIDPNALLFPVVVGASSSFLTPYGHQANSTVLGPGGYMYSDYARVGLPLLIFVGLAVVLSFP